MRLAKCAPFTPTLLATNESQQAIATLFAAIRAQLSIVEPAHECEPSVTHAWRPKQGPFSRLKNEPEFRPTNSEISSGGVKLKQLRSANSCPKISYNRIGGPRQFQQKYPAGFRPWARIMSRKAHRTDVGRGIAASISANVTQHCNTGAGE